ncbi:MAG: ankyrin repeat domain-containing protein [Thermoanaerobaculia bacterium]
MRISSALVVAALFAAVGLHAAPDAGKAKGRIVVSGKPVELTTSYVVERKGVTRVYLVDRALTEDELFDDDALAGAVQSKGVSAVVVRLSADREAEEAFYFHPQLPAGLSVTELTKFAPKGKGEERVAGRMLFDDDGFSWSFDVTFDAPVLLQLVKEEPLAADASDADVAKRELAKRDIKFDEGAFRGAVIDGDAEVVKLFVDAGMPPDTRGALGSAIDVKSPAVVKVLVDAGADVNATGPYRQSPLMGAASMGNPDVVRILLAGGADPNIPNEYGIAPLSVAAEQGQLEIVKILIAGKADVNAIEQPYGGSAIQVAVLRGYKEIVKTLIDAGTDVRKQKAALLELTQDAEIRAMIEAAAKKKR